MSNTVPVTDATFEDVVVKSTGPVLVDFWATWCGPCKMVAPILEELSTEYAGRLKIAKLDVDENNQTATKFNVTNIPTMIIFKGGKPVSSVIGFKPKAELKKLFDSALAG